MQKKASYPLMYYGWAVGLRQKIIVEAMAIERERPFPLNRAKVKLVGKMNG